MTHSWARVIVLLGLTGCGGPGLTPVARYPFVEDAGLRLAQETLTLEVDAEDAVHVDALFRFIGSGPAKNRVATFPIGAPRGGARRFRAEIPDGARRGGQWTVPVAPGERGLLPMGDVTESWDLWLEWGALRQGSGHLRVRYVQSGPGDFGYVLKSGAYWHDGIGLLDVVVKDPHRRLGAVHLEGAVHPLRGRQRIAFRLRDVEPAHPLRLVFR